jgi:uncharacterized membrane protein YgcG
VGFLSGTGSRTSKPSGNVLFIVAILAFVIFSAMFSLSYLTKTDVSTTGNLLREIQATSLAESIAAQIEAQVNSTPWKDRFWFRAAQGSGSDVTQATFGRTSPFLNLSKDTLPVGDYDFVGIVKDLTSELRQYRIYLEVAVRDDIHAFSWDKRWEQSLLVGLNCDTTQQGKVLEGTVSQAAPTDLLIDAIKTEVYAAPPPDGSSQIQVDLLARLRQDEKSLKAIALIPPPQAPAPASALNPAWGKSSAGNGNTSGGNGNGSNGNGSNGNGSNGNGSNGNGSNGNGNFPSGNGNTSSGNGNGSSGNGN